MMSDSDLLKQFKTNIFDFPEELTEAEEKFVVQIVFHTYRLQNDQVDLLYSQFKSLP